MLSLPSLAPRDSHSIWYSSSQHTPNSSHDASPNGLEHGPHAAGISSSAAAGRRHAQLQRRTPLARLRIDEESMVRRRLNVQDYGSGWIRPPGVPKSLHQMREERREMEEHREAMRREALAQELAEAEAEGLEASGMAEGEEEMGETRDLDDDIPEADGADETGMGADDDDDEEDEEDEDDEDVPRGVLVSRLPEEAYREALVRGETAGAMFDDGTGLLIDEVERAHMLQEDDLVHEVHEVDMDGDIDLDDDIPDADEEGGYEHTDTEAELSSSEDGSLDGHNIFTRQQHASSMVRSDGTRDSMDLSRRSLGSSQMDSQMGSSPATRSGGRNRTGNHNH